MHSKQIFCWYFQLILFSQLCLPLIVHICSYTHTQIIRLFVLSMLAHDCSLCECIGMHVQLNYFLLWFLHLFFLNFFYSALNSWEINWKIIKYYRNKYGALLLLLVLLCGKTLFYIQFMNNFMWRFYIQLFWHLKLFLISTFLRNFQKLLNI